MSDDVPAEESDIRRRAAWLLGMLVLVAALFVGLMVTFFNTSGGNGTRVDNLAGPTRPVDGGSGSSTASPGTTATSASRTASSSSPSTPPRGSKTCPDTKKCALDGDLGVVDAINAYRVQNGKKAVPGSVSENAKQCAFNNGNGCNGGWAETQVPSPDPAAAVQKILQYGKLLSDMKSIEVGWAYDPGAKQYYFALIRQG
ncbi:MAG: hypothetical protein ABI345_06525 [Jatrophihabitans sp.]